MAATAYDNANTLSAARQFGVTDAGTGIALSLEASAALGNGVQGTYVLGTLEEGTIITRAIKSVTTAVDGAATFQIQMNDGSSTTAIGAVVDATTASVTAEDLTLLVPAGGANLEVVIAGADATAGEVFVYLETFLTRVA